MRSLLRFLLLVGVAIAPAALRSDTPRNVDPIDEALDRFRIGSTLSQQTINELETLAADATKSDELARSVALALRDLSAKVDESRILNEAGQPDKSTTAIERAVKLSDEAVKLADQSAARKRISIQPAPQSRVPLIDLANAAPKRCAEAAKTARTAVLKSQRDLNRNLLPAKLAESLQAACLAARSASDDAKSCAENRQLNSELETKFEKAYQFEILAALWRVCKESGRGRESKAQFYLPKFTDVAERARAHEKLRNLSDRVYYQESKDELCGLRLVCHLKVDDATDVATIFPVGWSAKSARVAMIAPPDNLRVLIKRQNKLVGLSLTVTPGSDNASGVAELTYQNFSDRTGHQLTIANPNTVAPWSCIDCHQKSGEGGAQFNVPDNKLRGAWHFSIDADYRQALAAMPGLDPKDGFIPYVKKFKVTDEQADKARDLVTRPESFYASTWMKNAVQRRWRQLYPEYQARMARASAPKPFPSGIKDQGGYFSHDAIAKANKEIAEIQKQFAVPIAIETFAGPPEADAARVKSMEAADRAKYFQEWAQKQYKSESIQGPYLLVSRSPSYVYFILPPAGHPSLNSETRQALLNGLLAKFRERAYDDALKSFIAGLRERLEKEKAKPASSD